MKKKGYIILISIILLGILGGIGAFFIERGLENKLERNVIDKYGFEISYPKAYKDISTSGDNTSELLTSITTETSGEKLSEYMQNLNLVETVRNLKSEKNGIKLLVEAINIEKTTLSLEEICNRYPVMFKVYNEEKVVKETKTEIITINEKEVGKVTLKVKGENEDAILIAYLISLDDKEITVTFTGTETMITKNDKEINKIINSLKIY